MLQGVDPSTDDRKRLAAAAAAAAAAEAGLSSGRCGEMEDGAETAVLGKWTMLGNEVPGETEPENGN